VRVLTKSAFAHGGSSVHAQGGVAAALGSDDSPDYHASDTVEVGCGLTDPEVATLVTREGPGRIRELQRLGLRLDRESSGRLDLGQEAAHSRRRVAHAAGDATGAELVRALAAAVVASERIDIVEHCFALDLAMDAEGVAGVFTVDRQGRPILYTARAVVLATGGLGRLFACTTNPSESTGDGHAIAVRAGARLADLEFVQFHPTALADGSDPMALLTEALRGEGAVLVDEGGTRFMSQVHPDAELAPRDVVARAIWRHLASGHQVLLDARAMGDRFAVRFPTVYGLCTTRGLDPRARPVPVSPAAHYHMGGVLIGATGRTSLAGLWACGEVACSGLHGANRLASNSLLEAMVYGARVGEALSGPELRPSPVAGARLRTPGQRPSAVQAWIEGSPKCEHSASELRRVMWQRVGVERCAAGLEAALGEIDDLRASAGSGCGELDNMLTMARLVAAAALARTESRGAHFRTDFPELDPTWQRHLVFEGERLVEGRLEGHPRP